MKLLWGVLILVMLLSFSTGCTGPQVLGAMAEIAVGVLTDDPQAGKEAGAAVQADAERQQEINFLMAQLSTEEKMEGGKVEYSEDQGCYFYIRPNQLPLVWAEGKWMLAE